MQGVLTVLQEGGSKRRINARQSLIKNLTIARATPPGNRDHSYRGHPVDLQVRAEHVCTQGLFNRIASRTANDPIVGHKGTVSVCAASKGPKGNACSRNCSSVENKLLEPDAICILGRRTQDK